MSDNHSCGYLFPCVNLVTQTVTFRITKPQLLGALNQYLIFTQLIAKLDLYS